MYYIDRQTQITLQCDPNKNGSAPEQFTGHSSSYAGPMSSTGEVSSTYTLYVSLLLTHECKGEEGF